VSPREGSQDVVLMVEVVDGVEASLSLSRSSLSLLLRRGIIVGGGSQLSRR